MKKAALLVVGLLCISVSILAGEAIMNDTGEEATGLRVVFSTRVLITDFGDILTNVEQEGFYEFVFSGGTVEPWGSHWLNYTPTTARIVEYEWLTDVIEGAISVSEMLAAPYIPDDKFMVGGIVCDYLAKSKWGPYWKTTNPLQMMKERGFEWVRVWIRMESSSYLRHTSSDLWPMLCWRDEYWSSLEYATEILRQAQEFGLRCNVILLLSDEMAHAGQQPLAKAWEDLTEEELLLAIEQYCFETTTYLSAQGIDVELYHIGNEIEWGIAGFRPGEGIYLPPDMDANSEMEYMRTRVWGDIEARQLKAAIRGVRRGAPESKIGVHVNSLEENPEIALTFYETMHANHVDFDYAGLSLPYPFNDWRLASLSRFDWYEELDYIVRGIAAFGKPVIICEGSYPSTYLQN